MKSELTQICEGNRKIHNWRIVAGILALLLMQAVLGRMDSDARLAEAERLAAVRTAPTQAMRPDIAPRPGSATPAQPLQQQAAIGPRCGGLL